MALPERWVEVFAAVVEAGLAGDFVVKGFDAKEVPFDGLCAATGRGCDDGGVARLRTLSEPRGSSESALRFGGAAGATGGGADLGASPFICARRSPI